MNNEILKRFTGNDGIRPWMNEPFTVGEQVYATNAHYVAIIDKSKVDKYPPCSISIDFQKAIPINTGKFKTILISELFEAYKVIKWEDGYTVSQESIECETCDGFGEVEWEFEDYEKDFDCPVCDGSGESEQEKRTPNGEKWIPQSEYYISVYDRHIECCLFNKIVESVIALGLDRINVKENKDSSPSKGLTFFFADFEVVVMPVMKDSGNNIIYTI